MKAIRHVLAFLGIGFIAEQVARMLHFEYGMLTGNAGLVAFVIIIALGFLYGIGHEVLGD